MDDFLEQIAIRKNQGAFTFLYYLMWIMLVILGLYAMLNLVNVIGMNEQGGIMVNWIALIEAAVCGGLAFLLWRRADYCRVEYDYSFTNGTLDVSKVLNNKRRRYLTSLDMKDVIRCGPVKGQGFEKTRNEPNLKIHNWFLNRDAHLYYFYFLRSGVKHMMVVELTDEMIALIRSKSYLQRGAWVDEEGKSAYGYGIPR